MEDKTQQTVRPINNQQLRRESDKAPAHDVNPPGKDGELINKESSITPKNTNSSNDTQDRELTEVEYLEQYPIDSQGSLLYNKAIAEFDEDSNDVQLSEHYRYSDPWLKENGNF